MPRLSLVPLEDRSVPALVGGLDPSFGTAGVVHPTFAGNVVTATTVDSLNRTLAVGLGTTAGGNSGFLILRFLPDGTPDPAFGVNGQAVISVGGEEDTVSAVATDPAGDVFVAGSHKEVFSISDLPPVVGATSRFVVAKLTPAGQLDPSFGSGGPVIFNVGTPPAGNANQTFDSATGIAVDAAGDLVVAGNSSVVTFYTQPFGPGAFAVARLTPAGALDPAFGTGGKAVFHFSAGSDDRAAAVTLDAAGRIVVAGSTSPVGGSAIRFGVARLLPTGQLDPAFGAAGTATVGPAVYSGSGVGVATDPSGDVFLAGGGTNANVPTSDSAVVSKLLADGTPDATFGTAGTFRMTVGEPGFAPGRGLVVQPSGRLVVGAAAVAADGHPEEVVFRLAGAGTLDPSFNPTGPIPGELVIPAGPTTLPFATYYDGGGLAAAPDGRVVVALSGDNTSTDTVARVTVGQGLPAPLLVGGGNGQTQVFVPSADGTGYTGPGSPFPLIPGYTGSVRVAVADVNGDGVPDYIAGTGPGGPSRVRVVDGKTGAVLADFAPFEPAFTGGVLLAAGDLDNDGHADLAVTPDNGGGPRVIVYSGASLVGGTSAPRVLANFLGLADTSGATDETFRGGVRPAVADITGDGIPDLVVAAGFGGGPRVTVWDGKGIAALAGTAGQPKTNPVANFFAFEDTLRNGAFVAAGDVSGDGKADLIFGGGPGGSGRVRIADGAKVLGAGNFTTLDSQLGFVVSNFLVGDPNDRGGVRVAARDADGGNLAAVATGSGEGLESSVSVYTGTALKAAGSAGVPTPAGAAVDPFAAVEDDGVFVG